MIAIVDYSVGNLFSLESSLKAIGENPLITSNSEAILKADKIILPGVGAFEDAANKLKASGLNEAVIESAKNGTPLMGICLGMQLLFEKSFEYGEHEGLGLIKGAVTAINERVPKGLKIPHIGWNALQFPEDRARSPIFKALKNGDYVYFVHSFSAVDCEENIIASTEYGCTLTAAVQNDNVFGCQFHPEKSGDVGLKILDAFCRL